MNSRYIPLLALALLLAGAAWVKYQKVSEEALGSIGESCKADGACNGKLECRVYTRDTAFYHGPIGLCVPHEEEKVPVADLRGQLGQPCRPDGSCDGDLICQSAKLYGGIPLVAYAPYCGVKQETKP